MTRLISSFFYIGLLPIAPGTWGALGALALAYLLVYAIGLLPFLAVLVLVFFLGWWATGQITAGSANPDPSEVVIDEVVGQWIALIPIFILISYAPQIMAKTPHWARIIVLFVIPFGSFRIFDISKPWLIGWADRLHSPFGVMLDDVLAGLFSWLPVCAALYILFWSVGNMG